MTLLGEATEARIFRIAESALKATEQLEYVQANIHRIERWARKDGPFICRIDRDGIEKVYPKGP